MIDTLCAQLDSDSVIFFRTLDRQLQGGDRWASPVISSSWSRDTLSYWEFLHLLKSPDQVIFLHPDHDDGAVGRPDQISQVRVFGQKNLRTGRISATVACGFSKNLLYI